VNALTATTPIVDAIARDGYAVVPRFLSAAALGALGERANLLDDAGLLLPARVGRGADAARRADVRGDRIRWLDESEADPAEASLYGALEALRVDLNRELQLGLVDFEGHSAVYPVGAGYARHRDRFRDDDARVLSVILYLNAPWAAEDAGVLRLYPDPRRTVDVVPTGGTLVALLSERIEHEVLPASRPRRSMAGWFRRRV
jgi:SM-20-related protein